ncbi:MAG: hypothetical protein M1608_13880, partial [Candidatus Omnitrophica bacterium]|nr:hypothetical protein [Candidatus Omnitrophota bacterium]
AFGLWNSDVHMDRTMQWAKDLGINSTQSRNIGAADNGIDLDYNPTTISDATWFWHFNRSITSVDSRFICRDRELRKAEAECTKTADNPYNAAAYLGRALHPLQDWVAHGDFDRQKEAPSLTTWGPTRILYSHNIIGPESIGAPDNIYLDWDGPDGRVTIQYMHLAFIFFDGDRVYWARFHVGSQRISTTERLTKSLLLDFQNYVRVNSKPCGECQKAFLGDN